MREATQDELSFVRRLVREESGVVLTADKEYLIVSRLRSLARREQLASLSEVIKQLRDPTRAVLRRAMIEEILIGETSFFRDSHPFDAVRGFILPELMQKRALEKRLNLWCAAASTGQEPYSLAILLTEAFPELSRWSVSLLATDLSEGNLERARAGFYSDIAISRGLSEPLRSRHFLRESDGWRIQDVVRKRVTFARMNLIADWPALPQMDLVLMRNVLLYFDDATRAVIIEKLRRTIRPGGYLLLGTSESFIDETVGFTPSRLGPTTLYRRMG